MENITDIVNHFHNYEESSTTNVQKQKNIKNEITTFKNFYKTYILQKIKENKEKLIDSAIQEIDNQKFTQEAKNMLSKEQTRSMERTVKLGVQTFLNLMTHSHCRLTIFI